MLNRLKKIYDVNLHLLYFSYSVSSIFVLRARELLSCFLIVQDLSAAGEKRFGTDESVFNSVLCSRSRSHIRAVNDEYFKLTTHTLEQAINNEMSGDLRSGMIAIRKSATLIVHDIIIRGSRPFVG